MSLNVINTEYACGMTARDRLRSVLVERMLKPVVTSQANEINVPATGAMQPSDKGLTECSETEAPTKKRKLNPCKMKCSIISCDEHFSKMRQVIEHLNEMHHQNLKVQHFTFSSEAEFDEWIRNVERGALCKFVRRHIQKRSSVVHAYYYCSRSGSSRIITGPRKRRLKAQGYKHINRTCPAHVIKHVTHNGISVDYYATHFCYTELAHVRQECEAAADGQQLSQRKAKLEERRKQLEKHLLKTLLIIKSLTTHEEMDVVDTALRDIKPKLTAVRAKKASSSLVPNAGRCKEPSNKNVKKQQRDFSTKRRAPSASSSILKPSNEERKKIELVLLKTNVINNTSAGVFCFNELQLQN